jgi:hypothetical protein
MESFGPAGDSMADKKLNIIYGIFDYHKSLATQCPPPAGE